MTKPIEDTNNAAAIRTALDVPTTGALNTVGDAAQAAAETAAAKYTKPSTGIPASDLAAAAQTSLGKADSAIQDLAGMTAKFNAGTALEKAAFQSSVSGGRTLGVFSMLPIVRAALQATNAQLSDTVVLLVGDSTCRGVGSGGGGVGQFTASIAHMLSAACAWSGDAVSENIIGRAGVATATYDDRINEGGWTTLSDTLGGEGWQTSSAVADWTYTPKIPVSVADIYYLGSPGAGTYTVKMDGRAVATVNCNTTAGLYKLRLQMPLGMHVFSASWGKTNAYHVGVDAWDGRRKRVRFINAGCTGRKTSDWTNASTAWAPFNSMGVPAPNLIDISLGIDNVINGVADATTRAELLSLTRKAQTTGADVTLTTPNPIIGFDAAMDALQATYVSVAASTGAKLIDYYSSVGGRKTGMPEGGMFSSLHPSMRGYAHKRDFWLNAVEA